MPDLHVLTSSQQPADPNNNVTLTEVARPGLQKEYTLTVLISGKPVSVEGPFVSLDEAVRQAGEASRHYELKPIYLVREEP